MRQSRLKAVLSLCAAVLSVLFPAGCAAGSAAGPDTLAKEVSDSLQKNVVAYHAEMADGLTGIVDIYRADGNWYSAAADYSGSEMLLYQGKLYSRLQYNTPDTNWFDCTAEDADYSALIPGGNAMGTLMAWLPAPGEISPFESTQTNGDQTICVFSEAYTQSILDRQIGDAETLLEKVSQDEAIAQTPGLLDFYALSAEYLRRTVYTNATLTVSRDGGKITAVSLSYDAETPVRSTDAGGKQILLDETETHTEGVNVTFLAMDEAAVRAKIDEAAASLEP